jgi:branched-chain amino acid transport system substrate-binding protein
VRATGARGQVRRHALAAPVAAALCALAVIASGCGGSDTKPELAIYTSMPLSGDAATGRDAVEAERMALDAVGGKVDGTTIRLVPLDDVPPGETQATPEQAERNAERAADDPETIAYIGDIDSFATEKAMPVLSEAGILTLSPGSTAVSLTATPPDEGDRRTFARVIPNDRVQAAALVALMRQEGARRLFIVEDRDVYGSGLTDLVERLAPLRGVEIVGKASNDAQPAVLATRVRSSNADAVLFAGTTDDGALRTLRAISVANRGIKLFGPDGLADRAFVANANRLGNDVFVTAPVLVPAAYPPAGRRFFADLEDRIGHVPDPYAIYAYESMDLVVDALTRLADEGRLAASDPEQVRRDVLDEVLSTRNRLSILGRYSLDARGDTTIVDYGAYRVRDGRLVPET